MSELISNPVYLNPANLNPASFNPANPASLSGKDRAELKKVAEEFEAVFIAQLLKIMRETIEESSTEGGGFGKSVYTELFDQEIALSMARRGALGIGDIIYKSFTESENGYDFEPGEAALPARTGSRPAPERLNKLSASGAEESTQEMYVPFLHVNAPVSSAFGMRKDPFTGTQRFHKGIDLAAPAGTPVVAALPGKVVSAGYESGYGNTVLVEHDGGLQTRYGHLASVNVKAGDVVTSEDTLGKVGSTGRSTGAHLHFEVIRMGTPVDPAKMTVFLK